MPAVSGRYIVCPFCNSKKCKKECKSKKEGGRTKIDLIGLANEVDPGIFL